MTNFIASVELQQAGAEDYKQLILAMKKKSFIADKNNKASGNLTFRRQANIDIKEVIDMVLNAASSTGRKFSFTVMKDKYADNSGKNKRLALQ
jgi:hypothetical protein